MQTMAKRKDWRPKDLPKSFHDFFHEANSGLQQKQFQQVLDGYLHECSIRVQLPVDIRRGLYRKTLYFLKVGSALELFKGRARSADWKSYKKSVGTLQKEFEKLDSRLKLWLKKHQAPKDSRKLFSKVTAQTQEIQLLARLLREDEGIIRVYSKQSVESHLMLHLDDYLRRKLRKRCKRDDRLSIIGACLVAGAIVRWGSNSIEPSNISARLDRARHAFKRESLRQPWNADTWQWLYGAEGPVMLPPNR